MHCVLHVCVCSVIPINLFQTFQLFLWIFEQIWFGLVINVSIPGRMKSCLSLFGYACVCVNSPKTIKTSFQSAMTSSCGDRATFSSVDAYCLRRRSAEGFLFMMEIDYEIYFFFSFLVSVCCQSLSLFICIELWCSFKCQSWATRHFGF